MLVDVKKTIFFILTFWRNKHLTIQELQERKLPLIQLGHLLINNKKHIIDVYVIKNTSYH